MPYSRVKNIGSSDEIKKLIMAKDESTGHVFLLLDEARTVRIDRSTRLHSETVYHGIDVEDGSSIIIHLPFDGAEVAEATIITYSKGEQ